MGHVVFIKVSLALTSVFILGVWIFLACTITDISLFQDQSAELLGQFKEYADNAWNSMIQETKGHSILELTSFRDKRFIRRNKSGSRVLIVHRRQVASSDDCNCCPNEQDSFGINHNCPTGAPGLPGRPGIGGEPGSDGLHGRDGYNGVFIGLVDNFKECIPCPAGPPGSPGFEGPPGPVGPEGPPGFDGQPGKNGPVGEQGLPGDTGLPGDFGQAGRPGKKGISSVKAFSPPGSKGPPGNQGLPGQKGLPGKEGLIGLPGDVGIRGPPGKPGHQGFPGEMGAPGYSGEPGLDSGYCACPQRSMELGGGGAQIQYPSMSPYKKWRFFYEKAKKRKL